MATVPKNSSKLLLSRSSSGLRGLSAGSTPALWRPWTIPVPFVLVTATSGSTSLFTFVLFLFSLLSLLPDTLQSGKLFNAFKHGFIQAMRESGPFGSNASIRQRPTPDRLAEAPPLVTSDIGGRIQTRHSAEGAEPLTNAECSGICRIT